jgi:hypothetical protein
VADFGPEAKFGRQVDSGRDDSDRRAGLKGEFYCRYGQWLQTSFAAGGFDRETDGYGRRGYERFGHRSAKSTAVRLSVFLDGRVEQRWNSGARGDGANQLTATETEFAQAVFDSRRYRSDWFSTCRG